MNRKLHRPGRNGMKLSERIQMKLLICILGILLLAFLLGGQLLLHFLKPEEKMPPVPHVGVVQELDNVWLLEAGEDSLLLFRDGAKERYYYGKVGTGYAAGEDGEGKLYKPDANVREQIADVVLTDGRVTDVRVKGEKIHGMVLSAEEDSVEVEGYGRLSLAEDYKGYRLYNRPAMCTQKDLVFGYDFADFVMEDGKVCAILLVREEALQSIRVLLRTSDYDELLHQELTVTADTDFVLRYGAHDAPVEELHAAGDEVTLAQGSPYFDEGRIAVETAVLSGRIFLKNVSRSQGVPGYRGHLELVPADDGFAVVNVVSLEEYLYAVVPSEMPASYPGEALKAQAICARTYAYGHMQHAAYPGYGAHVDDSSAYQVYNNIAEHESTTFAVKETYGQLLYTKAGDLAGTYYYSTSCGVGSDANVWKTEAAKSITYLEAKAVSRSAPQERGGVGIGEYLRDEKHFREFITTVNPDDYESEEGWYRWKYHVGDLNPEHMCEVLKKRYDAGNKLVLTLEEGEYVSREIKEFTEVYQLYIAARGAGGVADELVIETDGGTYKVISEHNIRFVLCDGEAKVKRQNGSQVLTPSILPSGFFVIEDDKEDGIVVEYTLIGGGFGHGVGMSQNGARAMAATGMSGGEILLFFYDDCTLNNIY